MPQDLALELLRKRYPDLKKAESEEPAVDFYVTKHLKSRIGIVHTNIERDDMLYLSPMGVLYCGDRMRHRIDLKMKLERGADYKDFEPYFSW